MKDNAVDEALQIQIFFILLEHNKTNCIAYHVLNTRKNFLNKLAGQAFG